MFGVQSFGGGARNKLFKIPTLNSGYSIAKYDLTCFMDDSQNEIQGSFNYATSLYEKSTIERMVNHYLTVLEQALAGYNYDVKGDLYPFFTYLGGKINKQLGRMISGNTGYNPIF